MNPRMDGVRDDYRRLRIILIAAYMVIAVIAVVLSALFLWSEYRQMMQAAIARTTTLTRALEEHVLRAFTTVDTELRNAGRRLIETRALEHPSTPRVVEILREEAARAGFLRSIYVYDAAGRGHTTSLGSDIRHLRARDFEYLREVLDGPSGRLVIGRVISGAVTRRSNIPVARAVLEKNGRFAGIVGTAVEPDYFAGFYRVLSLEPSASLALLRDDGAVLVRFPEVAGAPSDVSGTPVFREHVAREAAGTADAISAIDGIRRIIAFKHVPGWNLIVVNTLEHAAVVAPWRRIARAVGLLVLASLGIFLALLRLALRELKRRAEAEERYVLAVQGSNDGIWDWQILAHKTYLSPRWKEILGYRDDEITNVDSSFFDLVHPEDRAAVREAITRHIKDGAPFGVELRMRHKDGSYRWTLSRGDALRDGTGRAVRMVGSITDITERKRAELELRRQTERFRIGQSAASLIVMDWDIVNDRIDWSDSPEWLRGPVPADTGKYPLYKDQVHPEDRESFLAMREKSIESLMGQTLEYRVVRTDGEVRWVASRHVAFAGPDGKAVRMLVALHDITERKRAEGLIQAALREKEVLLKEIYHRVKNNLQVVSSLLSMQGRSAQDETFQQMLQEAASRVKSIALVHEQLYRSGDLANIAYRGYVRQLVDHLSIAHRPLSARVPIRAQVEELQLGIETAVPCGLILNELISNAYKHGYGAETLAGEIVLKTERLTEGRVRLSVIDDGRGLPVGFSPDRASSLGMQLVLTLVTQLDGQLRYGSEAGRTFFEIEFRPQMHEAKRLAT